MTTTFILEDVDETPETVMRHVEAALLNIEGAPWDNVARMRRDQTAEYQTLYPLETVITFGQLAAGDSPWVAKIQGAFQQAWDDRHSEEGLAMVLSIELTDTEYVAVMDSLHEAVIAFGGYRTRSNRERSVHALELEHLRTLLAEAAAPKDTT
ncbi:hypothetical protein LCGC14_2113290 [marine sediment metagenome]|uniref:Uncharacterized protein n=1 Tax=marine sediment metagenome TaxID=412755 RepID=A0A0F9ETI2_9ZZZZ